MAKLEKEDADGDGDRQLFSGVSFRLLGFDILRGQENDQFCIRAREDGIIVVNEYWVDDSISQAILADPERVLYWPVRELSGISGGLQLHICSSGYTLERCQEFQRIADFIGASFYEEWTEKATHLICYKFEGHYYNLAKKCKANIVNHKWLEDCFKQWRIIAPIDIYTRSCWEFKLVNTHSKGTDEDLDFHGLTRQSSTNTPKVNTASIIREYRTPESKICSLDTKRKAFSTGAKRSKVQIKYDSTMRCKRLLTYGTKSDVQEVKIHEYAHRELTEYKQILYAQKGRKMAIEGIKLILLNAYGILLDLHQEEKSLKGLFTSKNFLTKLKTKKVVLYGIEARSYSTGDGKVDKSQFVTMVKEIFGEEMTGDIAGWLVSIEKGVHDNVVRHHINMLHASSIFGEFCFMYHSLLKMKAFDNEKYEKLLESLHSYDTWKSNPFQWCILEENRGYVDPQARENNPEQTAPKWYPANVFGLVQLIRNCWEHPAKLYPELLLAILLGECPKLLSDLQQVLYSAGYLPHLDTEDTEPL